MSKSGSRCICCNSQYSSSFVLLDTLPGVSEPKSRYRCGSFYTAGSCALLATLRQKCKYRRQLSRSEVACSRSRNIDSFPFTYQSVNSTVYTYMLSCNNVVQCCLSKFAIHLDVEVEFLKSTGK